ncbi:hypothetical protein HYH03_018452 [Edaphochlamys debaryana]|uniref:Helicase ATP-binding domain-containing protein n=1 Tax=Edaphochlamys debaryana TaxID=47281 RepID=A0A836BPH7_9CHLO|nr:hypothetical protein HYH03_018452 [Edaphochlamys debaryana]|eukprot:KAG2482608.1 hypothetical protein HYH03_018452 [Edaphochlamys debaryana]
MVLDVKSQFERVAAELGPSASASQLLIAASTAAEQLCLEASTRRALLQETPSPRSSSPLGSASSLSSLLGGIDLGNLFGGLDIGGGGALSRSGSGSSLGSRGSLGSLGGGPGRGSPGSGNGSSGGAARSPGSTSGGGGGSASRYASLATWKVGEIGGWLLGHLNEGSSKLKWLTKTAGELTPAGVVEVLDRCDRSTERTRSDNGEDRSPGGIFSKEVTRYLTERNRAAASLVAASAPPPAASPPLRSYQRDVVGLVSLSWGLPLSPEVSADGGASRAMQLFKSYGNWRGNWFFCASTGLGKTRVFTEVIRACATNRRPGCGYLALILVPRVLLTEQHEQTAIENGLVARGISVASHCGGGMPLTRDAWAQLLSEKRQGKAAAVVVTADSIRNLVEARRPDGEAVLAAGDVDLLVFDEAHHCRKNHAYAKIADALLGAAREPRPLVLAVSASPADGDSEVILRTKIQELLQRLRARLHVVAEDDPEVAAVLARAQQSEVLVGQRPVDAALMKGLRTLTVKLAYDVGESLAESAARASAAVNAGISQLEALLQAVAPGADGSYSESTFGAWLKNCSELAERERCAHLQRACKLLDVMRKATWLVEDGGFEGALPYLARKAAALRQEEADEAGGSGGGGWDVGLRVSEFVRRVLEDPVSSLLAGLGSGAREVLRDCFASGQLKERTFPKFWALLEYLENYKGHRNRNSLRGIVFVRTRQAMYHVADMIRRSSQLSFFEVLEVTGHAAAAKSRAFRGAGDRHGRGMSDSEQRRDPSGGAKLLVATSAPEEGVDVPSCEFVVRYNAADNGIRLLQSMGRARQRLSEFVTILQENTQDLRLHRSSQDRAETLRLLLRSSCPGQAA